MIIAIDFDGTCVTHEYPNVGKDIGAAPVLRKLVDNGHKLILYTMRSLKSGISPVTNQMENGGLSNAIQWFVDNDVPLYSINLNPDQKFWTDSPKVYAQMYIDDAALGCPVLHSPQICSRPYVDWKEVEDLLQNLGIIK